MSRGRHAHHVCHVRILVHPPRKHTVCRRELLVIPQDVVKEWACNLILIALCWIKIRKKEDTRTAYESPHLHIRARATVPAARSEHPRIAIVCIGVTRAHVCEVDGFAVDSRVNEHLDEGPQMRS